LLKKQQTERLLSWNQPCFETRKHHTLCLLLAGRVVDAQQEMLRILGFEEKHPWALVLFALTNVQQDK
jgi:hypothetical protein